MAVTDYRKDLDIATMVFNRLPFLTNNTGNLTKLGEVILEVMSELEVCFMINTLRPEGETDSWVGYEEKYLLEQRVVVADVVAVYLLLYRMIAETGGVSDGTKDGTAEGKYLKKTKAGSVEVEWDQIDSKKGGMSSSVDGLLEMYQASARRKASLIGCMISWDNADMIVDRERNIEMPFIVVSDCGCNDGGSIQNFSPAERI
jgi:hypothetical protein